MSMDAPPQTRQLDRDHSACRWQAQRGARQIVIPMTREAYDECWHDSQKLREYLAPIRAEHPDLFPGCLQQGYLLNGFGRTSQKLEGIRLRKIRSVDRKESFHLRPSFVMSFMTGTADELEDPLLLASYGVPMWVLTRIYGHSDMYWFRLVARLGRNSLVGTTVRDPQCLPEHLAADEHHGDWAGQKGFLATTAGEGCLLGLSLTKAADEEHLTAAYGDFAAEARDVQPAYAPKSVNTDGWSATQNALQACFPTTAVILCFLHGFLKIRDRARKKHDLHRRVWDVFHSPTADAFRAQMQAFRTWFETQSWNNSVREMVAKLWDHTEDYAQAYTYPGCRRTSNMVDRPMNRLQRLLYAGRGLHGHCDNSERRLRGWALLLNFRPFAHRSGQVREYDSPAHRLNRKRYHHNWLHNLQISASLMGYRQHVPAIR
jgi:hypothetical protein